MSGAAHLASIYGSEQDKVNCSFYLKIGACRHGDRCSRKHIKPQYSQTIVIQNMYQNPAHRNDGASLSQEQKQAHFDEFFEDVYCELVKYGHLLELHVCDNVGDHLIGNVYARFDWEDEAQLAVDSLNDRWYAGRPLCAELSPVTDFREACCRQNDLGECARGGFCNFLHRMNPTISLTKSLQHEQDMQRKMFPSAKDKEREAEMAMFKQQVGDTDDRGDRGSRRGREDDYGDDDRSSRRRRY